MTEGTVKCAAIVSTPRRFLRIMTFGRGTANTVTIHPLFYPPCPLLKHNLRPGVFFKGKTVLVSSQQSRHYYYYYYYYYGL